MSSAFDQEPPFWYRHALWVGLPFGLLMVLGGTARRPVLLVAGLLPLIAFMCASFVWSRRHRIE